MKLYVDPTSAIPLHAQVESLLGALVKRPEYQNGKLLPPETELALRLGISRSTVRAGIEKLVQRGLLVRKAGHGTRVVPHCARTSRMESWESFSREMASQGVEVQTFFQKFGLRGAPVAVADALNIPRGTRVYSLERVRGFDNSRIGHFLSWFHPRLNLQGTEDFSQPLYSVIEAVSHVYPERSRECIAAVAASSTLAALLDVDPNTPLLQRRRWVTERGDRMLEYAINHYLTDNFSYTIDIRRNWS